MHLIKRSIITIFILLLLISCAQLELQVDPAQSRVSRAVFEHGNSADRKPYGLSVGELDALSLLARIDAKQARIPLPFNEALLLLLDTPMLKDVVMMLNPKIPVDNLKNILGESLDAQAVAILEGFRVATEDQQKEFMKELVNELSLPFKLNLEVLGNYEVNVVNLQIGEEVYPLQKNTQHQGVWELNLATLLGNEDVQRFVTGADELGLPENPPDTGAFDEAMITKMKELIPPMTLNLQYDRP